MALATSFRPIGTVEGNVSAIVRAILSTERRNRRWLPIDEVAAFANLGPIALAEAVERGRRAGSIHVEVRPSGSWLSVDAVARSIVRPKVKRQRRGIDPTRLGPSVHAALVADLAREPAAVVEVEPFALRRGEDVEALWDALTRAEAEGLVDLWPDGPTGPAATLSTLAADRLGLALAADGSRWIWPGDADPTDPDGELRIGPDSAISGDAEIGGNSAIFDLLPDPGQVEPVVALVAFEDARSRVKALATDQRGDVEAIVSRGRGAPPERFGPVVDADVFGRMVPQPVHILGLSLAWPVATPGASPPRAWIPGDGTCPACKGQDLCRVTYCLVCCRSGLDGILPSVAPPRPARPVVRSSRRNTPSTPETTLKGGLG